MINYIFKLKIIAEIIQYTVDDLSKPIPIIFGRLLCQLSQYILPLRTMITQNILPTMIRRDVWKRNALWKGFKMSLTILWKTYKESILRYLYFLKF